MTCPTRRRTPFATQRHRRLQRGMPPTSSTCPFINQGVVNIQSRIKSAVFFQRHALGRGHGDTGRHSSCTSIATTPTPVPELRRKFAGHAFPICGGEHPSRLALLGNGHGGFKKLARGTELARVAPPVGERAVKAIRLRLCGRQLRVGFVARRRQSEDCIAGPLDRAAGARRREAPKLAADPRRNRCAAASQTVEKRSLPVPVRTFLLSVIRSFPRPATMPETRRLGEGQSRGRVNRFRSRSREPAKAEALRQVALAKAPGWTLRCDDDKRRSAGSSRQEADVSCRSGDGIERGFVPKSGARFG